MADHRAIAAPRQSRWQTARSAFAGCAGCDFLSGREWDQVAGDADQLSPVANGLHLLSIVGAIGRLGADECRLGETGSGAGRTERPTQFNDQR